MGALLILAVPLFTIRNKNPKNSDCEMSWLLQQNWLLSVKGTKLEENLKLGWFSSTSSLNIFVKGQAKALICSGTFLFGFTFFYFLRFLCVQNFSLVFVLLFIVSCLLVVIGLFTVSITFCHQFLTFFAYSRHHSTAPFLAFLAYFWH